MLGLKKDSEARSSNLSDQDVAGENIANQL